ncbi:MAG: YaiO family outer membrane beta-barrel protein [Bacteroidales bacterium]|nr:YaiO family outer membrane beta-barrel protein [Bacteroidales bacterium]
MKRSHFIRGSLKRFRLIILVLFSLISSIKGFGQNLPLPNNPDSLLQVANDLAFNEKTEEARVICNQILVSYPEYHDAAILMGRTYAWESRFDEARKYILPVLDQDPMHKEAIYAMIDVSMWSGSFEEAIKYIDLALLQTPASVPLLIRKAQALIGLGKEDQAALILNQVLDIDPSNKEAIELLNSLNINKLKNRLTLGYHGDYFEDGSPWHLGYLEYARRTKAVGTLIGRVNYARKFDRDGVQFEVDAYPIITSGTYLYLNAGYSPDDLFPTTRFGFEVFQSLPLSFEVSAGFRMLNYVHNDLMVLTGSVSKYYKKYYFSFRPYFTFASTGGDSQAYYLTARRYFTSTDHHLTLIIGTGFSADDGPLMQGDRYNIERNKAMLYYQQKLSPRFLIRAGMGYQQYSDGIWGDKVSAEIAISYLF